MMRRGWFGLTVLGVAGLWMAVATAATGDAGVSQAPGAIRTPVLLRDGDVDSGSLESIISGIIKPGMSDEAKAMAVYDYLRTRVYHWGSASEPPRRDDFEFGIVYDPIKLVNVYGYGYCFQNRAALEALWQAAGLEARSGGIGGHAVAEVFYDGGYHYLDADQHGYSLLPDGRTVASIDQVSRDPMGLLVAPARVPEPFFPATRDPKAVYESKVLLASMFASTGDNYFQHDKIVTGHRMDITLLPGMRYERCFEGDGRWNYVQGGDTFECSSGYHDPATGPRDFQSGAGYGTGRRLYQPDLTPGSGEYRVGVCQDENIRITGKGLVPAQAGCPAWCVFRIRLPYVIVGWPKSFTRPSGVSGAAVLSAVLHADSGAGGQGVDVSLDRGATWAPVWSNACSGEMRVVVDMSAQVAGWYEYWVRIRLADASTGGARLESLSVQTAFQVAPRSLPAIESGTNRFSFRLGDGTEMESVMLDPRHSNQLEAAVWRHTGVAFKHGRITGEGGMPGELIVELKPPKSGVMAGIHAELACSQGVRHRNPLDDITIAYAENRPAGWRLLHDDAVPPWMGHWCYHANASATCSPGTESVFVRLGIRTVNNAAIHRIHLRYRWRPPGPGGMPARGMRIEHAWREQGVPRRYSTVIRNAPSTYTVVAGGGVSNEAIVMEPVRAEGLSWRENDPPVTRPPLPQDKLVNEHLRDAFRAALRKIDADPVAGLAEARNSGIPELARCAAEAERVLFARDSKAGPPADVQGVMPSPGSQGHGGQQDGARANPQQTGVTPR